MKALATILAEEGPRLTMGSVAPGDRDNLVRRLKGLSDKNGDRHTLARVMILVLFAALVGLTFHHRASPLIALALLAAAAAPIRWMTRLSREKAVTDTLLTHAAVASDDELWRQVVNLQRAVQHDFRVTRTVTILFLAANPLDTERLELDKECAAIHDELKLAPYRDELNFQSRWAVDVDALMRHLAELKPEIVHFSGHADAGGIIVEGAGPISGEALQELLATAAIPAPRLVVLNGCDTDVLARPVSTVIDCVVGMNQPVEDQHARWFAVAFYRAIAHRRSVANAVAQGQALLRGKNVAGLTPRCLTRAGVDADQVILLARDAA